jgi:hypothetical protein
MDVYRFMVPACDNKGRPFSVEYHKAFDAAVAKIAGGLTISPAVRGVWIDLG